MQLGVHLARRGTPPLFCEEAMVRSTFAGSHEGERSQRTRWEHGHLSLLIGDGPRLLAGALRQRDASRLLMLVLDMLVPPLALLSMALLAAVRHCRPGVVGDGLVAPARARPAGLREPGGRPSCWRARASPSDLVSLRELLGAPLYMLAKIPHVSCASSSSGRSTGSARKEIREECKHPSSPRCRDAPDGLARIAVDGLPFVASDRRIRWPATSATAQPPRTAAGSSRPTSTSCEAGTGSRRSADGRRSHVFTADGKPIVWASRLQGTPLPCRLAGSDLFIARVPPGCGRRAAARPDRRQPRYRGASARRSWRVRVDA
ncbi:MAG: hypothetical protein QM777_15155 [Pseudorhodoferax sp.]